MKTLIAILTLWVLTAFALASEDTDLLKGDFKRVSAVARVSVQSVHRTDGVGDHNEYLVGSLVLETFKGSLKAGQRLEFYEVAEDSDHLKGDKIVFLKRVRSHGHGPWVFVTLANSTRPDQQSCVRELRKLEKSEPNK